MQACCRSRSCSSLTEPLLPLHCLQGNPKFLEAVTSWQRKLGTVDVVLNVWNDVQKKWQALESIFVGSADIRVQLPEDSKRFDAINADYMVGGGRVVTMLVVGHLVFGCPFHCCPLAWEMAWTAGQLRGGELTPSLHLGYD